MLYHNICFATMTGLGPNKQFTCDIPDCRQCFLSEDHLSPYPLRHNADPKTSFVPVDQTPTPTTIFRKCEEAGLLQALQVENPFEETFRKATEGMRSGSNLLELPIHLNAQESLNTPQVIIPGTTDNETTSRDPPIKIDLPDPDDISLSHDPIQPSSIIRREADTSDCKMEEDDKSLITAVLTNSSHAVNTEKCANSKVTLQSTGNGNSEESRSVQVLLRMPDGKLVQLSTLPVEPASASAGSVAPNIPIIKVDGPPSEASDSDSSVTLQNSMSLAKMKLKQTLMKNNCSTATSQSPKTSKSEKGTASPRQEHVNNLAGSQPMQSGQRSSVNGDVEADVRRRKFLERNRAAAMRCREKKKTWVQQLEINSSEIMRTNQYLEKEVALLRSEVAQLKTLLLAHKDCPVTKAMAQGQTALPGFVTLPARSVPATTRRLAPAPSTIVIQQPTLRPVVRPVLVLNDPLAKRRRHASSSDSSTPSILSPVISASPFVKAVSTVSTAAPILISNFVTTAPAAFLTPVPTPVATPVATPVSTPVSKQAFILPKSDDICVYSPPDEDPPLPPWDQGEISDEKVHNRTILSSNVIKVNPNVVDRDIEIVEVKSKKNR